MDTEKRELTLKEKNILTIILSLLVLLVFIGIGIYDKYMESKEEMEESMKTTLVQDESRYMTVLSCARKFLDTVQNGTSDEIISLLKNDYRDTYNINANNLSNYVPKLAKDPIYVYAGEEMYQKRISKNVIEYYLIGNIKEEVLDDISKYTKYDLTITLYENKFVFSIKPGIGDANL